MIGLPISDRIRALGEAGALRLAQSLALAECSLLALPAEAIDFPQRPKAKDGGVDGRTSFPADAATRFPTGRRLWQVKSGHSPPKAEREFAPTKAGTDKWVVQELRKGGIGYVLFWTYDPVDPDAEATRKAFRDELEKVAPDVDATFLFLGQIVSLVQRHPGIAMSALGLDGEGVLGLEAWRKQFEGTFETDAARAAIIDEIRAHGSVTGAAPRVLRVYGDPGVGKSRVVLEAIDIDGLRERTLIATKASSTVVPEMVVNHPEAGAVLVLDPASDADVAAIGPFLSAAEGRLVVIAVQERNGSVLPEAGHPVVPPLDRGSIRRLIDPANDGTKADEGLVSMAGGYPGLALQIREVISRREPGAELVSVARDPDVSTRLARLVSDQDDRNALSAIALFGRVGVDGDARPQLTAIAQALRLDDLSVAARLDGFEGRLITSSGDYRRVSPDIVAVWLCEAGLEEFGRRIIDAAKSVPAPLAIALIDRLAGMPGSRAAPRIAKELAELDRFMTSQPTELDALRSRMLLALCVLDPTEGLKRIGTLLATGGSIPAVASNDLLAGIEELLWTHETFEAALGLMFDLARVDVSERTYGPRLAFEQVFQLALSGTQEPYATRVAVARRLVAATDDAGRRLVAAALGGAFDLSATRGVSLRGRVSTRDDWYPASGSEQQAAIKAAWDLVTELARDAASQRDAARSAAHAIRTCLRLDQGTLLETDLPAIEWAPAERALLLHELRVARDHDPKLTTGHRELLDRVMKRLEGDDFGARLRTAMAAEPHQLGSYRETEDETYVDRLADEMAAERANLAAAGLASHGGNPQTVELLFRKFGARVTEDAYVDLLDPPAAAPALIGFIAARDAAGSSDWATHRCREWLADPGQVAHVPALTLSLTPSDERVGMAVDAVGSGADPYQLSLLAYGSRVKTLAAPSIVRVVEALVGHGGIVLEHALGILAYWLAEPEHTPTSELVSTALRAVDATFNDAGPFHQGMLGLYRSLILRHIPEDIDELMPRVVNVLRLEDRLDDDDLALVCRATSINETIAADAIVGLVAEALAGTGLRMWAWRVAQARLLSVLAGCTSPDIVADALRRASIADVSGTFGHVAVHDPDNRLDPMFQKLIEMGGEDLGVWSAAARAFALPGDGHWRPESAYLRARAEVATLTATSSSDPLIQRWASWVAGQLTERGADAERREADNDDS